VLGAISLDLFAVLLGGAVALLPIYADQILDVGPWGLGFLRAAPGVGAIIMIAVLIRFPVRDHAGTILLVSVAAFGAATIVFGVSTVAWLSIVALALVGAFDMVSVYIREIVMNWANFAQEPWPRFTEPCSQSSQAVPPLWGLRGSGA